MPLELDNKFRTFSDLVLRANPEYVLPGRTADEIAEIEAQVGVKLPESYRSFLASSGGLWLFGGAVQMTANHPFVHDFPSLDELTNQQIQVIRQRGGKWPPPSQGMLCFAEYFLESDGDQVLFKTDEGLIENEYPVYYYAHDAVPARVSRIADSFGDWLNNHCIQSFSEDD